jgi:hypothetical protein
MRNGALIAAGLLIAAVSVASKAAAQHYPERVVQIIAPSTAGSSADILGRVLADGFSARLGKPFIVVNKPGANGVIGTADVARANPDGYTLLHGATYSITVQPLTDKQAGYTAKSFTPICQTFKNDQVAVVPPSSPLQTAGDLIAAARRKPGAVTVGIPGIATIPHLAVVELAGLAKVEFNDVPFKGPAEEMQNVRSGQIDFAVVPLTAAAGSGLPMPGLFAAARNPSLPDDLQGAGLRRGAIELRRPLRTDRHAHRGHARAGSRLYRGHEERCRPAGRQAHVPAGRLLCRQRWAVPQSRHRRRGEAAARPHAAPAVNGHIAFVML